MKEQPPKQAAALTQEQREIAVLQEYKDQITDQLQEELRMVAEKKGIIRGQGTLNREAIYDARHNTFLVNCEGTLGSATLGDLIADVSLGSEYTLSLDSVPPELAKQYVLARAKTRIQQLYNRQVALQEKEKSEQGGKLTRAGYFEEALKDLDAKEKGTETHAGKQFEQDAVHLLKQIQFDIPELGVEVEEVNVVQDMDEKIDFIVKIHEHHRGVQVEEEEKVLGDDSVFGIQFTLKWKEDDLKVKQNKIDKSLHKGIRTQVDDVLLVTVPITCAEVKKAHEQWHAKGCPPGGPVKLYAQEVKLKILEKIVDHAGTKNIIEEHREKIEKYFNAKK